MNIIFNITKAFMKKTLLIILTALTLTSTQDVTPVKGNNIALAAAAIAIPALTPQQNPLLKKIFNRNAIPLIPANLLPGIIQATYTAYLLLSNKKNYLYEELTIVMMYLHRFFVAYNTTETFLNNTCTALIGTSCGMYLLAKGYKKFIKQFTLPHSFSKHILKSCLALNQ